MLVWLGRRSGDSMSGYGERACDWKLESDVGMLSGALQRGLEIWWS